ncbi:hypothetical protein Hsar01_02969 [Haloferula sargassicola]|uniref:Uncharacterized protein n=1 Tax=Haloferula sargassicola TaxID=490096 RepID=A0ABP9UQB7_9BACT
MPAAPVSMPAVPVSMPAVPVSMPAVPVSMPAVPFAVVTSHAQRTFSKKWTPAGKFLQWMRLGRRALTAGQGGGSAGAWGEASRSLKRASPDAEDVF